MIAACYSMDIYCDCPTCSREYWNLAKDEYTGRTFADVKRQARRDGWRISKDNTRAFAKGHQITRPSTLRSEK